MSKIDQKADNGVRKLQDLVFELQQMELYIWKKMVMPEHVGDYLKGNCLLRYDASQKCLRNW